MQGKSPKLDEVTEFRRGAVRDAGASVTLMAKLLMKARGRVPKMIKTRQTPKSCSRRDRWTLGRIVANQHRSSALKITKTVKRSVLETNIFCELLKACIHGHVSNDLTTPIMSRWQKQLIKTDKPAKRVEDVWLFKSIPPSEMGRPSCQRRTPLQCSDRRLNSGTSPESSLCFLWGTHRTGCPQPEG